MTAEKTQHFIALVAKMRTNQKEYFKYRTSRSLENSKRQEKEVDNMLIDEAKPKVIVQTNLF